MSHGSQCSQASGSAVHRSLGPPEDLCEVMLQGLGIHHTTGGREVSAEAQGGEAWAGEGYVNSRVTSPQETSTSCQGFLSPGKDSTLRSAAKLEASKG